MGKATRQEVGGRVEVEGKGTCQGVRSKKDAWASRLVRDKRAEGDN